MWGSSATNVFAVGLTGTILHYDGANWSAMASGTSGNLRTVWGSSATDVYAAFVDFLHYDGVSWSTGVGGTHHDLLDVWGSGSSDVFAVGKAGTIVHYDGAAWTIMASGTISDLNGVDGSGRSDVFAVGQGGLILHYDGASWTTMASGTPYDLFGVWANSPTDVFAVGAANAILHYDGTTWTSMGTDSGGRLFGVWGRNSTDVYAVGNNGSDGILMHFDGATWSIIEKTYGLRGVWGHSGSDRVYAVGWNKVYRYTGTALDTEDVFNDVTVPANSLRDLWGYSDSDLFVVGAVPGTLVQVHFAGLPVDSTWQVMNTGTYADLFGVWGASSTDIFAVGAFGTILHFDGAQWNTMGVRGYGFGGIWGSGPNDIYAAELFGIEHYDGVAWMSAYYPWGGTFRPRAVLGQQRQRCVCCGQCRRYCALRRRQLGVHEQWHDQRPFRYLGERRQ